MSVLSTGSPDPDDPQPTPEEPKGLAGEPGLPLGDDPRLGNVGHSGEAPTAEGHEDALDEASDETFPASDPPSWSAAPTLGEERPEPSDTPGAPRQHGLGRVVEG